VTVRFTTFRTHTRSHTLRESVTSEDALSAVAVELPPFFDARENPRQRKIRLIGVGAEKLVR